MSSISLPFDLTEACTTILDALAEPAWTSDSLGQLVVVNSAARQVFDPGTSCTDWFDWVYPDERSTIRHTWAASRAAGELFDVTCRLLTTPDQVHHWFRIRGRMLSRPPFESENLWLCSAQNMEADVAHECSLRQRLDTQTAMLDASIDCIKFIAADGSLIEMNKSGCEALGVLRGSGFGMNWLSLLPQDVHRGGQEALMAARRGNIGRFPGRSELPDGAPRYWDNVLTPVLNAQGSTEAILCLSRDVTVQRELEEQLRQTNAHLQVEVQARAVFMTRLWNTSHDLMLVTTSDGHIMRANPAWQGVLGHDPDELMGRHVSDYVMPDERLWGQELIDKAASSMERPIEIRHLHRNGSLRWIEWIAVPFGTEIYATGRHVTAAKEATERARAAEEALHHAQKLEAIGLLTGTVAHDFNNLLSVLKNAIMVLRRPELPEERRARFMDILASTTERAIAVTRQLLDFARRSPVDPVVFLVPERVQALREMLKVLCGGGVQLDIQISDGQGRVLADPSQFDTAIVNLVTNACDAMGGSGRIDLYISATPIARATWNRHTKEGDFVAVAVADTGPGISEEMLERVFEPFFTTKQADEGTGLGLPQVVGFAERSGGAVGLETALGVGSRFTLYLPRALALP